MPRVKSNRRTIDLLPPTGGIDRGVAFQQSAPYKTIYATNVRGRSPLTGRKIVSQRAGLAKEYYTQLGSGKPIRMLSTCDVVRTDSLSNFQDDFSENVLGAPWNAVPGIPNALPIIDTNYHWATNSNAGESDCTTDISLLTPPADTSNDIDISLYCTPVRALWNAAGTGTASYILWGLCNTYMGTFQGIEVRLNLTANSGAYTCTVTMDRYDSGAGNVVEDSYTGTPGDLGFVKPGYLRCTFTFSSKTLKVYWQGNLLLSQVLTMPSSPASTGKQWGFGIGAGGVYASNFLLQYYSANGTGGTPQTPRSLLLASSGGKLYREAKVGTLEQVTSNYTLASDRYLPAVDYLQSLYIADSGNVMASGTDGTVDSSTGLQFDSATYSDWTTLGMNNYDYCVVATGGTGLRTDISVFLITSVIAGHLVVSVDMRAVGGVGASGVTFQIVRVPKYYEDDTDALAPWVATLGMGSVPANAQVMVNYLQRCFIADKTGAFFMSRKGNFWDWNYSGDYTDEYRAFDGTVQASSAIGKPIVAAFPLAESYMLMCSRTTTHIMRGDPVVGGAIDLVSDAIGCIGPRAGVVIPNGEFYWLTNDGLAKLPVLSMRDFSIPNEQMILGKPELISRPRLPNELRNINPATTEVQLLWSDIEKGIYIILTDKNGVSKTTYFYDTEQDAFWCDTWGNTGTNIYIGLNYHPIGSSGSKLLVGCQDGYIRTLSAAAGCDDGDVTHGQIDSEIYIGPLKLGDSTMFSGMMVNFKAVVPDFSGDLVRVYIHRGVTVEQAFMNAKNTDRPFFYLVSRNDLRSFNCRARGPVVFIQVSYGTNLAPWGIDTIAVTTAKFDAPYRKP